MEHRRAIAEVMSMLGDTPLVFDGEFSYESFFEDLEIEGWVYYKGTVKMNLIGYWKKGMKEAMWITTNLDPKTALKIYLDRMKIEESFKDLKSLLGLECIMSKDRQYMEKLIMLVLIAYTIGVLVGEKLRDRMYRSEKKWTRYSGLFILIRQRVTLPGKEIRKMKVLAYRLVQKMLHAPEVVPA